MSLPNIQRIDLSPNNTVRDGPRCSMGSLPVPRGKKNEKLRGKVGKSCSRGWTKSKPSYCAVRCLSSARGYAVVIRRRV